MNPPTACILAIGFLQPAMLGALALVAAPIVIHWLSRRRYRPLPWAAMIFLLDAEKRNRRRMRLEQWLLLALRCLAMALLALLFARPFLQPGLIASLLGGRQNVERIIVLDDSLSLRHHNGASAEFDGLRAAAGRLVSWLVQEAPGDRLTVLLASDPENPLVSRSRLDPVALADAMRRLEQLQPEVTPAAPQRSLDAAASLAAELAPGGQADLYVLSDFQSSEWIAGDGRGRSPLAALEGFEPDHLRVVLIASGVQRRDNLAITQLEIVRPIVVAGIPARVRASLVNHTGRPVTRLPLQPLLADAALPGVEIERLEAGSVASVEFEITAATPGWSSLQVRVGASDRLPDDDERQLAIDVRSEVRVLLVNGQPDADPLRDEVSRLRSALAPPGPFSSGIRTEAIGAEELPTTDLSAFDCVLLCNVSAPVSTAADALARFARSGGGVAVFCGDQVDAEEYNRTLHADGTGVLACRLEGVASRTGDAAGGVGIRRTIDHPVTALLAESGAEASETLRFRRFQRVELEPQREQAGAAVEDDDDSEIAPAVLARFTDAAGSPAIVERRLGRGRVVLVTTTADLDWNDWARAPDGSYVVTMLELVQHLARRDSGTGSAIAGRALAVPFDPQTDESVEFRSPVYPQVSAVAGEPGGVSGQGGPDESVGPIARQLGTHVAQVRRRDGSTHERWIAVNPDAIEADLATAAESELRRALGGIPCEYVASADAFLRSAEQSRREIWPALLLALAAALMAEQALACWFGSERSASAALPVRIARWLRRKVA